MIVAHQLWRDQIVFPYHMQHHYGEIDLLQNNQGVYSYRNCDRRVYIDAGAGLGSTLLGLRSDYDECHAFEPDSALFESLRTKHYPKCAKVVFHQKAVWVEKWSSVDIDQDARREERLAVSASSSSSASFSATAATATATTHIRVPSIDLGSFIRKIPLRSLIVLNVGLEGPPEDTAVLLLRRLLDHAPLALQRVAFVVLNLDRGGGGGLRGTMKELKARLREELHIRVCDQTWCPHRDPLAVKKWDTSHHHEVRVESDAWWYQLWNKYMRFAFVLWAVCEPGDDCFRPGEDAPHYKVGGLSIIAVSVGTVWLVVTLCKRKGGGSLRRSLVPET